MCCLVSFPCGARPQGPACLASGPSSPAELPLQECALPHPGFTLTPTNSWVLSVDQGVIRITFSRVILKALTPCTTSTAYICSQHILFKHSSIALLAHGTRVKRRLTITTPSHPASIHSLWRTKYTSSYLRKLICALFCRLNPTFIRFLTHFIPTIALISFFEHPSFWSPYQDRGGSENMVDGETASPTWKFTQ